MITGVTPTSSGEAPKVKVRVRLNIHGILAVSSASMTEELPAVEEPKSTESQPNVDSAEPMDTAQDDANTGSKVNGIDKPSDTSEQTDSKEEPMNTDKDASATEKENQVWPNSPAEQQTRLSVFLFHPKSDFHIQ